ncbi:MAG: type III-A CRISPR-associated RAMP protein Csm3 [Aulosira sp. ZfuVER01]|nr:type III-A CRISPR-associated RAMP protein Csm3 [Aulosira sp. ZfuVER01]MDZ7997609.1 type III-A CRISPR-associated RAMP protein Csm3 [Aulosira sp. DedVER01a]MDZ8054611.1 type III-A CRISPR-associated RAMP protein Csm3 [Aulosira sp. ZfuCHP01]
MPASIEQKPLLGKVTINTQLVVETGLHIGGGGENLDIGGLDKPVIRDPITQYPYLPGSSIKGKLRSILERLLNKPLNRTGGSGTYRYESDDLEHGFTEIERLLIRYEGANSCQVSRLFGSTGSNCWVEKEQVELQALERIPNSSSRYIAWVNEAKIGRFVENNQAQLNTGEVVKEFLKVKGRNCPARLIIRDCHLLTESAEQLKKVDTGLFMTEWKFENGIDRVTAAANPRQLERVPAGSKFNFELIYTVEDREQAVEDLQNIAIALAILEDDALGGHGSRGYGKVKFQNFNFSYRSLDQYRRITSTPGGSSDLATIEPVANTQALLDNFVRVRDDILRRLPPADGNSN